MLGLFDSIEHGYPIGSLLIWDTSDRLPSLDQIAGIEIPSAPASGEVGYVLDGHQRLSTLFGSLLHRPSIPSSSKRSEAPQAQREWMWDIYRVLGDQRERAEGFRHLKRAGDPPPHWLPMRAVLRTMDFLAYSRRLSSAIAEPDALIDEAEQLAQRIKSYQVAVVRLKRGDLRHAVEVFSRLNSSGQSMTPDQMVSALTYQADGESLADRIAAIREDLGGVGYGDIAPITIFRSVLAIAGETDVQNARWETLAGRVQGKLAKAVRDTDRALRQAIRFLRDRVEAPLVGLIPYQLQLMLLTACFHWNPIMSEGQLRELERWFWGTSWSGFFAGANTTQVKNSLQQMKDFAACEVESPWEPQTARPFPDRFDFRSARVRAFILWELREYPRRLSVDGKDIDPVELLARSHTTAYQHVVRDAPNASHPANRLILPTGAGVSVRKALLALSPDDEARILASHGIPPRALDLLRDGDAEGFIATRAEALVAQERAFMETLGISPAAELGGDTDIDTE